MRDILLLGMNHKTAPVDIREQLSLSKDETVKALELFKSSPLIQEIIIFSTCNRVELLTTVTNELEAVEYIKNSLSELKNLKLDQFEAALYTYSSNEAVKHVFRVASSLDSMIVGEPQILGQIKEAYRLATSKKTSGVILNRLLHRAFFVSKRVRTETGIGGHAVSISYAAIELGRKIFGTIENKKVLLIGAGEMAELAVEHLIRNKATDICVANRTFERGLELAKRFCGKAISFDEITDALKTADIIISSTGAPNLVIRRDQVKGVMKNRRNRPIFFIDIAVPRDIDPEINHISNAYVYNIDDLENIVDENMEERQKEASKAERIVEEAVIDFRQWHESLEMVPTIVALRNKIETMAKCELNKTLQSLRHLSDEDCYAVDRMTQSIINKILHDPMQFLKRNGCNMVDKSVYIDLTRKLFKLDQDNQDLQE